MWLTHNLVSCDAFFSCLCCNITSKSRFRNLKSHLQKCTRKEADRQLRTTSLALDVFGAEYSFIDSPNINDVLLWSVGSSRGMKQDNKRLRFLKRFQNILEVYFFCHTKFSTNKITYTQTYIHSIPVISKLRSPGAGWCLYTSREALIITRSRAHSLFQDLNHYINKLPWPGVLQRID
jgi:hypothetical protein